MKYLSPRNFLSALLAFGLISSTALAAPKSRIKAQGRISLEVALAATVSAPAGASASGEIEVSKSKITHAETVSLTLTTSGLAAGSYSVDALLAGGIAPAHLGDFIVDPVVPGSELVAATIVLAIPAEIDAASISHISLSDSSAVVLFEGDVTVVSVSWKYTANTQVTGPEVPVAGKGKKAKRVHGHALSQSFVSADVETKRHFLWVAFGAPASVELTINVDGVPVGTVTSTKQGKVMFREMPETVVLRTVKLITLTDLNGMVIMQAAF